MADVGRATVTFIDHDGERSSVSVRGTALTSVNYDAQEALWDTLRAAIGALTDGANVAVHTFGNFEKLQISNSSSEWCQRENKWLVQYHDQVTLDRYTIEIPCADLENHLDANDPVHADIGDAAQVDAFITAFEAYVLSKAGNAVTVDEITAVGRNV
jgi:hypothetical protein